MSVGKLRMTVVVEWDVEDPEDYQAETLEEAAKNQQKWLDDGDIDIETLLGLGLWSAEIEAVKGTKK